MGEFGSSLAVSALVVAFVMLSSIGQGMPVLFALSLLAVSQIGFFALTSMQEQRREYVFIITVLACYAVAALSAGAFSAWLALAFVPLVFCAPAVTGIVKNAFS